ncbi:MAG: hypothetical protein ACRD0S_07035, partial [Acidimicrobiales bacterium]
MATALGEHDAHVGVPAATKVHGLRRPQRPQVATGRRKQLTQMSGPPCVARRAMGRTRPQRPPGRGAQAKH